MELLKRDNEFYVGILVWLLTILIAYSFWATGDENIRPHFTPTNLAIAALVFSLYLAGYFISHGILQSSQTKRHKIVGLFVSGLAATYLSAYVFFFGMMGCMVMMIIIQLVTLIEQKWAMVVAIMVPTVFVLIDYSLDKEYEPTNIVVYSIANVLALITSYRAIAERSAKLKSERLVTELSATQILLSATTKRDERLRIARNLHDILGHQLTALSLQLEVASHVDSEAQKEHIENAKTISTSLLSNVRETVSEFREEKDLKLHEALSVLAQGLPNLKVKLTMDWDESLPDERQVEVLFRCAQEALTNIVKHSNATHCDIKVSNDEQYLTLTVRDNGRKPTEIKEGNGLKGMLERVTRVDGNLDYKNTSDGFTLCVKLPLAE